MHQNLSYKIIAVLLAVALWFYVLLTEENPIVERRLSVPLRPPQAPRGMVVSGYPEQVQVTVQGSKKAVAGAKGSILATFSLASPRLGEQQVRVEAASTLDLAVMAVHPQRVRVRLERVARKTLRVEPAVLGAPPPGVVMGEPRVSPPTVTVSGPDSVIDRVAHARVNADADLAGLEESQTGTVYAANEYGATLPGVKIAPARVRVVVPAERRLDYKTVPLTVRLSGLPAGVVVKSVVLDPVVVTVGGEDRALANLSHLEAGTVDLGGVFQPTFTSMLTLRAPAGLLLLDGTRVQVRVTLEQVPAARNSPGLPYPPGGD